MARRNHSLLDDLVTLPWWFNVILAAIVYVSLRFWLPTFEFQNPAFKGIATGAPNVAHIFAGILLLVAAVSVFNAWRKGRLLERQTGIDSLNAVSWQEFAFAPAMQRGDSGGQQQDTSKEGSQRRERYSHPLPKRMVKRDERQPEFEENPGGGGQGGADPPGQSRQNIQ